MNLSQCKSAIWALSILAATYATPSNAVTVYDTITDSYFTGGTRSVGIQPSAFFGDMSYSAGARFTTPVTGYIESLTLSLYGSSSGTVHIFSDNGGQLGVSLGTLAVSVSPSAGTFTTGSYSSGIVLEAGMSYWILATGASPLQTWAYRGFSPQSVANFFGLEFGIVSVVTTGEYFTAANSISGFGLKVDIEPLAPVPLPAALPLFATVLAGGSLIAWRRRRKAAKLAA